MLKTLLNEFHFDLTITPTGPFLIKDGKYNKEFKDLYNRNNPNRKTHLDSIFMCMNRNVDIIAALKDENKFKDLIFYVPGTSFRGWIRSHAEKIVRTVCQNDGLLCCDPFEEDETSENLSCSKRLDIYKKKNIPDFVPYANACVICKLFGCTGSASRITISDSKPKVGIMPLSRDGIAIDRFTGGNSSGALFKNQVLSNVSFKTKVIIKNFEIWQLGLLAYVFRDMEQELVPFGFGKSKGYGQVKSSIDNMRFIYFTKNQTKLAGMGELCLEKTKYDLKTKNVDIELEEIEGNDAFTIRHQYAIKNQTKTAIGDNDFWKLCAGVWNSILSETDTLKKFKSNIQINKTTIAHDS